MAANDNRNELENERWSTSSSPIAISIAIIIIIIIVQLNWRIAATLPRNPDVNVSTVHVRIHVRIEVDRIAAKSKFLSVNKI